MKTKSKVITGVACLVIGGVVKVISFTTIRYIPELGVVAVPVVNVVLDCLALLAWIVGAMFLYRGCRQWARGRNNKNG